jgi:hypothetical protein
MAGKELRISERRFEVFDWSERFVPQGRLHACGRPVVGSFKVTLPRSVGIGAVVEVTDDGRRGIVDDEDPRTADEFLVTGSILAAPPEEALAEPSSPPPQADIRAGGVRTPPSPHLHDHARPH